MKRYSNMWKTLLFGILPAERYQGWGYASTWIREELSHILLMKRFDRERRMEVRALAYERQHR